MIIETSDNRFFRVWDLADPALSHCWNGIEVKRASGGAFIDKKNARPQLVRKAATRVIAE